MVPPLDLGSACEAISNGATLFRLKANAPFALLGPGVVGNMQRGNLAPRELDVATGSLAGA